MNLINFLEVSKTCSNIANGQIGDVIRIVYSGIKIGVPIILIIVGMIDMGKAIAQQKEDEIKKAQSLLVKKAIAALIVFLMFNGVQILVGAVGGDSNCMNLILNGQKETNNTENKKTKQQECEDDKRTWDSANGVCN